MAEACPFDPTQEPWCHLGQFHCELCGEMILGGIPHLDYSIMDDPDWWELASKPPVTPVGPEEDNEDIGF
jgi:hypothetical protein